MRLSLANPNTTLVVQTRVREASMFQLAAEAAAHSANRPDSIECIMRLALNANTPTVRRWAARWLEQHYPMMRVVS